MDPESNVGATGGSRGLIDLIDLGGAILVEVVYLGNLKATLTRIAPPRYIRLIRPPCATSMVVFLSRWFMLVT